jgi:hypothetical protein
MKQYQSFAELKRELKILKLKQQIGVEELKIEQNALKTSLSPKYLLNNMSTYITKYGVTVLLKKLLKRKLT